MSGSGSQPALTTKLTEKDIRDAQASVMGLIANVGNDGQNISLGMGATERDNPPYKNPALIKLVQVALNNACPKDATKLVVDGDCRPGRKTAEAIHKFKNSKENFDHLGKVEGLGIETLAELYRHEPRILGNVEKLVGKENMPIVCDLLSGKVELKFGTTGESSKQFNALLEKLLPGEADKIEKGCKFTDFPRIGKGTYLGLAKLCSSKYSQLMADVPEGASTDAPVIGQKVISDIIIELAKKPVMPAQ